MTGYDAETQVPLVQGHFLQEVEPSVKAQSNIIWLHGLRVFAIFMVIVLHASGLILAESEFASYDWWVGNIYNAFTRMCVPIFFMISGYLLLTKQETVLNFYSKRFSKVLLPFVVWTGFYSVWYHVYRDSADYASYDWSIFYRHMIIPSYYHMWFLYVLSVFYLLIPLLKRTINMNSDKQLLWFIGMWFVTAYLWPIAFNLAGPIFTTQPQLDALASAWAIPKFYWLLIGFLTMGVYLGRLTITRQCFRWSLSLAVLCYLLSLAGTYWLTANNQGKLNEYFYFLSPSVVIYSAAWFVALKYLMVNRWSDFFHKYRKLLVIASTTSFGVYLVHPLIMDVLNAGFLGVQLNSTSFDPVLATALYSIVTFSICTPLVFYIQKIPVINKLV